MSSESPKSQLPTSLSSMSLPLLLLLNTAWMAAARMVGGHGGVVGVLSVGDQMHGIWLECGVGGVGVSHLIGIVSDVVSNSHDIIDGVGIGAGVAHWV